MLFKLLFIMLFCHFSAGFEFRSDYSYSNSTGGWLKLHRVPATWRDAMLLCHAEGAVLASPLTYQLRAAMVGAARERSIDSIFTGVHTTFAKGSYASVEGVPLSELSISWATEEPDNLYDSESCIAMEMSKDGNMADVSCDLTLPFVCYLKKTKSLPLNKCGTHDAGYTLDSRTGKCYKFHQDGLTWPQAHMTCMAEGGHLVVINSQQEADVVKSIYAKNPDKDIFGFLRDYAAIGITNSGNSGPWMTVNGETLREAGYHRWASGEPDNRTQPIGEFCGIIHRSNAYYYDFPCNWIVPFICEKQPIENFY